jgi:NAD(P)-dependent dehydrogenase (short-subunit alcohol dehydrogenase family)
VTGAGGGLGRAVVEALAASGAHIACSDLDHAAAEAVAKSVRAAGGTAVATEVDVRDETRVRSWRDETASQIGPATIVVNVAGAIERRGLRDLDHDGFMRAVDVNLGGAYSTIRAFADDLLASDCGRIVNVASIAGLVGYPGPSYAASKAGLVNLTRALLLDFWGTGTTVNSVCPGAMETAMFNPAQLPESHRRSPLGRIVTVEEVAASVEFLCRPEAAGVNGVALTVDGGASAVVKYFDTP